MRTWSGEGKGQKGAIRGVDPKANASWALEAVEIEMMVYLFPGDAIFHRKNEIQSLLGNFD